MPERTKSSPSKSPKTTFPQIEGIPIAAKFKGPGPVYSLPPTLGINAKYIGHRAPAFSFGVKIPPKDESIGPGPAAFSVPVLGKGPSFSLQGGFKKTRHDGRAVIFGPNPNLGEPSEVDLDNPGPAKYQVVDPQAYGPKAPAYTITSRSIKELPPTTPGPATYSIPSTVGFKQISVPTSPAPTIAPSRHSKLISNSPGPAAYQPVDPTKLHHSSPAYSLGGRWEKDSSVAYANTIPGPGQYNPTDRNKTASPSYSFRQKHSEYEHFVSDPEDDGPLVL